MLPPEKAEKLEKLLISYSAGDRHSLLETISQFNHRVINHRVYILGESRIIDKIKPLNLVYPRKT